MSPNQLNREGWSFTAEKGSETAEQQRCNPVQKEICPQLPGTVLRIFIPPGAVINLLNLIELTSPGGICIILRIPLLGGEFNFSSVIESIQKAGGSVEVMQE